MKVLKTRNEKSYRSLAGNYLTTPLPPKLEFEIESDRFVPGLGANGSLTFNSTVENILYIDLGDGSPIQSHTFTGQFSIGINFYKYATKAKRKVKIWFELPTKVNSISATFHGFIGEFPTSLGLYSFSDVRFRSSPSFENFPINVAGGVYELLQLDNTTKEIITEIPEWILGSKINILMLGGRVNLSNRNTSRLSELGKIPNLTFLGLWNNNMTADSFPDTLKYISSLRTLSLGANKVSFIPVEINNCKQITSLIFGYGGGWTGISGKDNTLLSWGEGIVNMPNLTSFEASTIHNIAASLPYGLETAVNCKTIVLRSCFLTQERIDAFVDDAYVRVIASASMNPGNSMMRQINCNISWVNAAGGTSARPSGVYQAPPGFVIGSNNGNPTSQMEKIYVIVKQYGWTITTMNTALNGTEIFKP